MHRINLISLFFTLIAIGDPGDAYVQMNKTLPFAETDREKAIAYYYRGLALKLIVEAGDESSRPAAVRDLEAALAFGDELPTDLAEQAEAMLVDLASPTPTPGP